MNHGNDLVGWRPFARPRVGAGATLAVVFATATLLLLRAFPETAAALDRIDAGWRDWMVSAERPGWISLARVLEVAGGAWVLVPLWVLVAVLLWARGFRDRFWLWVGAVVAAQILSPVLKALYDRPRPAEQLSRTIDAAFPSGHTTQAAVMAFGLVLVLVSPGRARLPWTLLAFAWAALVAWSRTYLRDHWLSDVAGGFLLGLSCALLAGFLTQRRMRRRTVSRPI